MQPQQFQILLLNHLLTLVVSVSLLLALYLINMVVYDPLKSLFYLFNIRLGLRQPFLLNWL
jgi:hypothetical protein